MVKSIEARLAALELQENPRICVPLRFEDDFGNSFEMERWYAPGKVPRNLFTVVKIGNINLEVDI